MTRSEALQAISELVFDTCRPADCETPNDRIILVRGHTSVLVIVPRSTGFRVTAREARLYSRIREAGGRVFLVCRERAVERVLGEHYSGAAGSGVKECLTGDAAAVRKDSLLPALDRACPTGLQVGEESSHAATSSVVAENATTDMPLFLRCPFRHPARRLVWPFGTSVNRRSIFASIMGAMA